MSELIIIEEAKISDLFTEEAAQEFIKQASKKVGEFVGDLTTETGRKEIASASYSISKLKTKVDGYGVDLVADWKKQSGAVDKQRKYLKVEFDKLRDELRAPLTEYEAEEVKRIDIHKEIIKEFLVTAENSTSKIEAHGMDGVKERLAELKTDRDRDWQEFEPIAHEAADKAINALESAIEAKEKSIAQEKELEELRAEKTARDLAETERLKSEADKFAADKAKIQQAEREKQIADNAKLEAEKAAKLAAENEARINVENLARVEREKEQEIQRVKDEQEAARKIAEKIKADEADAIKAREDDLSHRIYINNQIETAFLKCGVDEKQAKTIINAIFNGNVSHVKISY